MHWKINWLIIQNRSNMLCVCVKFNATCYRKWGLALPRFHPSKDENVLYLSCIEAVGCIIYPFDRTYCSQTYVTHTNDNWITVLSWSQRISIRFCFSCNFAKKMLLSEEKFDINITVNNSLQNIMWATQMFDGMSINTIKMAQMH